MSSKDYDNQLKEQDQTINTLKNEIAKTRNDIKNQQSKELNTASKPGCFSANSCSSFALPVKVIFGFSTLDIRTSSGFR